MDYAIKLPFANVVKANKLIEARYKFTLWEMRVFTSMVSLVKPNDIEFECCKLYIKDLMKFYNSTSKEDYETIRRVPVALSKKQIELMYIGKEGKRRWGSITLFPTVTRPIDDDDNNAYIELKFNDDLKPSLLALKDKYRIYDIRNIVPLRSVYSIRLFELLKQYENTKHKSREFELSYLKEMLGLTETDDEYNERIKRLRRKAKEQAIGEGKIEKYPLYADFKRRVLLKAQTDLTKFCDITFSFDEIKEGRKVKALKFYIKHNKPKRLANQNKYDNSVTIKSVNNKGGESKLFEELYPKVKKWIAEDVFRKMLVDYSDEQIRKAIKLTLNKLKKGDTINNVAGYIIALSKQKTLFDSTAEKTKLQNERKKAASEQAHKKQELENELKKLSKEWSRAEAKIIETIFVEQPEEKEGLFEKAKQNRFSHYKADKTDDENLKDPMFAAAFSNIVKKAFPDRFEATVKKYESKIKSVKVTLRTL